MPPLPAAEEDGGGGQEQPQPAAEPAGAAEAAAAAAAAGAANSNANDLEQPTEGVGEASDVLIEHVDKLSSFLAQHATAANLDPLWEALERAGDARSAGDRMFDSSHGALLLVQAIAALQGEVGRLHGVLQEAGRLAWKLRRLEGTHVRRARLLVEGHPRPGLLSTAELSRRPRRRRSPRRGGGVGDGRGGSSDGGSSSDGSDTDDERDRERMGKDEVAVGTLDGSQAAKGHSSGSSGGGGCGADAATATEAAAATAAGQAEAGLPAAGGTAAGAGEAGDSSGASTATDAAAAAAAASFATANGPTNAAAAADDDAKQQLKALADATASWCIGVIFLLLYQGFNFRYAYCAVSGHELLDKLQDTMGCVRRMLRKALQALHGKRNEPPSQSTWLLQATYTVKVCLTDMAHQDALLQLYDIVNNYCCDGWRMPATAAAAADGGAAAPAAAAAPTTGRWQPGASCDQLLELHARSALEAHLARARRDIDFRCFIAPGSEAQVGAWVDALTRTQEALGWKAWRRKCRQLARKPLLHSLVSAAIAAEMAAARDSVGAARDAYKAAARQAAALGVAAAGAAGKAGDGASRAGGGGGSGAAAAAAAGSSSGPAAEAAEAAAQALAGAQEALFTVEGRQHVLEVLQQLCDWQEQMRQACESELQGLSALKSQVLARGLDGDEDGEDFDRQADSVAQQRAEKFVPKLRLNVAPGTFTATAACQRPCYGALCGDGSQSTSTRSARLSAECEKGPAWWADLWEKLTGLWPCGVVPCAWGSVALYGSDAHFQGEGEGEGGERADAAAAAAAAANGLGPGALGVSPQQRQSDAARTMHSSFLQIAYATEEALPFVVLGSYTLALLLRHLCQIQDRGPGFPVLQPTAIRGPGRHSGEDPHSLRDGVEPCVVVSQLGRSDRLTFPRKQQAHLVRNYLHAASSSHAAAGSSSGSSSAAAAAKLGKGAGGAGGKPPPPPQPQPPQQPQHPEPSRSLVEVIAADLKEQCVVELVCTSPEDVAGAMMAISQLRQSRREELQRQMAELKHGGTKGEVAKAVAMAALDPREVGFAVSLPGFSHMSSFVTHRINPQDPNFDLAVAGQMTLYVLLLSDVDARARRVTPAVSALDIKSHMGQRASGAAHKSMRGPGRKG
ncbi:hypothetical protein HYH02_009154 [Chlamydomonas schloesseri]|uniref:Uncharacterized protein n=1 Tax=Chlamydomonas schloesseri TaxID=2026947 RepID=A0A836B0P1_9CHLO|nr:hypothetical protein HYH02_009154 [Chlamydomonas schloesseri]|eukprot:KAG2444216.1 hypothetical protein HYH02_009154 [Chlamydomonas schloesseri]